MRSFATEARRKVREVNNQLSSRIKLQIPSSNIQRNTKLQIAVKFPRCFDAWLLEFLWSLDVGAWMFFRLLLTFTDAEDIW